MLNLTITQFVSLVIFMETSHAFTKTLFSGNPQWEILLVAIVSCFIFCRKPKAQS